MREYNHEFADHWFYTPSFLEKTSGLSLVRAGRNVAKPNYYMGPRFIMYYSFHFIRTGSLVFNQNETLESGDMFCLWSNIPHQYGHLNEAVAKPNEITFTSTSDALRMFWIALDGKQAPILARMIGLAQNKRVLKNILNPRVEQVISEICELLQEMDKISVQYRSDAKVLSLIYSLFHEISTQGTGQFWDEDDDWLSNAEEYIRLHCMDGVTVHDVVRHVGLSRSHFSRSFTTKYGFSPNEFIKRIKMDKAVEMLKVRDYSITEIALTLGYPDLYSFTRAFTRHFTISPSRYRKGVNGEN